MVEGWELEPGPGRVASVEVVEERAGRRPLGARRRGGDRLGGRVTGRSVVVRDEVSEPDAVDGVAEMLTSPVQGACLEVSSVVRRGRRGVRMVYASTAVDTLERMVL